ncbi:hypothetical protein L4C36_19670 [Photobacterium japonica]|uniref:hypothetical protein n=1 Tax=Photobacterium japonica TaxID=2910235 RepID=UPI003D1054B8
MMKIESPVSAYIAFEIEYLDDRDLIEWAVNYLLTSEYSIDDIDLIALLSINTKDISDVEKAGSYLSSFISRQWPEFSLKGSKAEGYAKKLFHHRLKQYLAGKCRPYDVCKMICPIEQLYDFPEWLGNLYNACDWLEPGTQPADCRYLEAEIEQVLKLQPK